MLENLLYLFPLSPIIFVFLKDGVQKQKKNLQTWWCYRLQGLLCLPDKITLNLTHSVVKWHSWRLTNTTFFFCFLPQLRLSAHALLFRDFKGKRARPLLSLTVSLRSFFFPPLSSSLCVYRPRVESELRRLFKSHISKVTKHKVCVGWNSEMGSSLQTFWREKRHFRSGLTAFLGEVPRDVPKQKCLFLNAKGSVLPAYISQATITSPSATWLQEPTSKRKSM